MEITINLPEHTIRKVRAFSILSGGGSADLESVLVNLIDETLSTAIVNVVSGGPAPGMYDGLADRRPPVDAAPLAPFHPRMAEDASGISGGLGDEYEEEDGGTSDEQAFVPKSGGVSGTDLEKDMEIEDPEHEAKVDASAVQPSSVSSRPEKLFADMADMPEPSIPDPRESRRRKPLKSKAKVTGFTGQETSTF